MVVTLCLPPFGQESGEAPGIMPRCPAWTTVWCWGRNSGEEIRRSLGPTEFKRPVRLELGVSRRWKDYVSRDNRLGSPQPAGGVKITPERSTTPGWRVYKVRHEEGRARSQPCGQHFKGR